MIKINCAHDTVVDIGDLVPHPKNPNRHPSQQIKILAKIIKKNGWRAPITVSELSGYIIRGHCRFEAAKLLKIKKCPVDFQEYLDKTAEIEDLVADNKIAELSIIDDVLLKTIVKELPDIEIDLNDIGYSAQEIKDLLSEEIGWNPEKTKEAEGGDNIAERVGYGLQSFWKDISKKNAKCFKYQLTLPVQGIKGNIVRQKYSQTNLEEIERIIATYMREGDFFLENCCGWSSFGSSAKYFGFSGVGVDIWDVAIEHSRRQIEFMPSKKECDINILNMDAMCLGFKGRSFDFVYCNPPFMDQEKYSDSNNEIGHKKLPNFFWNFVALMRENFRVLKNNCLCVITINDRREGSFLNPIQKFIIEAGYKAGFKLWDFVIAEVLSQGIRLRKKSYERKRTVKCHEYIIVFKKEMKN